jgi:5'-nucleotidase|tara:strand:- start:298 stop:777 length:480 start_codon:yes stop_codon:yes gene_type:complete
MKNKLRIFIDMDGVLADFQKAADLIPDSASDYDKKHPDEVLDFSTFEVIPGAKEAVDKLIDMGHDLFIASTPPWNNKAAWGQKGAWIEEHFPALKRKVFLTHRKDLLDGDILIDDTTYRGQLDFKGTFIQFGKNGNYWPTITNIIQQVTHLGTVIKNDL